MTKVTITVTDIAPSAYGAGGWDCEVLVVLADGSHVAGGLTLLADEAGFPTRWGSLHHWVSSGELLTAMTTSTELADAVELEAAKAIQLSGVMAATPEVA